MIVTDRKAFPRLVRYNKESDRVLTYSRYFPVKAYSLDGAYKPRGCVANSVRHPVRPALRSTQGTAPHLRKKIIESYNKGNISQRQLAKLFQVALSFVQKLLKQYKETGNIAPLVRIKQTPTKLNSKQLEVLKELMESVPKHEVKMCLLSVQ